MNNKQLPLNETIMQPERAFSRRAFTKAAVMAPVVGTLAAGSWLTNQAPSTAFAAAHSFSSRVQIDRTVNRFHALSATVVLVEGTDGLLWLEHAPFGNVPPARTLVSTGASSFQVLSATEVVVLEGTTLWLLRAPFSSSDRTVIDTGVSKFQALSATEVVVLLNDFRLFVNRAPFRGRTQVDGNIVDFQALSAAEIMVLSSGFLSLLHTPFGNVPTGRTLINTGFLATANMFHALSDTEVLVHTADGRLWLFRAPFGNVPANRTQIDMNFIEFRGLSSTQVLVLGQDHKLWLERAPFGNVPPARALIDTTVRSFQALSANQIMVLGTDGNLWLENGPF